MRCVGRTWLIPRMSKVPESYNPEEVCSVSQFKICINRCKNLEITKEKIFRSQNSQQQSSRVSSAPQNLKQSSRRHSFQPFKFLSALLLVTATKNDLKDSVLFFSNIVTSCIALHLVGQQNQTYQFCFLGLEQQCNHPVIKCCKIHFLKSKQMYYSVLANTGKTCHKSIF